MKSDDEPFERQSAHDREALRWRLLTWRRSRARLLAEVVERLMGQLPPPLE
jgi:hypothetical protein